MKQVIPFYKEIVFKNKIANLTSISLEHNEKVVDGEVSGEFIVYGDYKVHNDTTEKETFRFKLPFTALIPDDVDLETINVDITDFKYEQIDSDVLRVDIDFLLEGKELERFKDNQMLEDEILEKLEEEEKIDYLDEQIDNILNVEENDDERDFNLDILSNNDVNVTLNEPEKVTDVVPLKEDDKVIQEQTQVKEEVKEEYITYHVHIVTSNDSVESIMKMYNAKLDTLKEYNDIKELKVGDKVIIPFIADE